MYKCEKCNREFKKISIYTQHSKYCKLNKETIENIIKDYDINKISIKSISEKYNISVKIIKKHVKSRGHNHWSIENENILLNNLDKSLSQIIQLLHRDVSRKDVIRKMKRMDIYDKYKKLNPERYRTGLYYDEEDEKQRCEKISLNAKENKIGGHSYGKNGYYKGYWCDSRYELAWIIYHLEHNIPFERNSEKFPYYMDGRKHHYTPDFIKDGIYYEIKGYVDKSVKYKIEQFPKNLTLIMLYKDDLKKIFDYVFGKYGNYIENLYDEREDKVQIKKFCAKCNKTLWKDNQSGYCKKCILKISNKKKKKVNKIRKKQIKKKYPCMCGNLTSTKGGRCMTCYHLSLVHPNRPDYNILIDDVNNVGYIDTGIKYGVSGSCIRKWLRDLDPKKKT